MPDTPQKFYLTTPIYYVNARPHIGHAYTTIVADVIARRHRLLGHDTFFLTGTDEHGQKIERSALAAGIPPQQFADQVSQSFRDLWDRMGITYSDFIRTTEPRHKQGVQHLFQTLRDRGHIYLSTYTGQYCVSDEAYVDGPPGVRCPDCGRVTETVSESNYYFRLSAFQLPLLDLIESNQLRITPDSRRNEVLSFLRGNTSSGQSTPSDPVILSEANSQREVAQSKDPGTAELTHTTRTLSATNPTAPTTSSPVILSEERSAQSKDLRFTAAGTPYIPGALKDLSISRTSFKWGIPVPGDEDHVIYVWLDALANYMTAIGYGSQAPEDMAKFEHFWPADLHLVGKEIIRFHCVYWPAILLALNPAYNVKPTTEPGAPRLDSETWVSHEPQQTTHPLLSPEQHSAWAEKMLPKAITAHGWLLFEDSKMSKSKGNIVRTETILDTFGALCQEASLNDWEQGAAPEITATQEGGSSGLQAPHAESAKEGGSRNLHAPEAESTKHGGSRGLQAPEMQPHTKGALAPGLSAEPASEDRKRQQDLFASDVLRYFLLREIPFGQDGSFSFEALVTRYNADLANGYGNLVSRTLSLVTQNLLKGFEVPQKPWLCLDRNIFWEGEGAPVGSEAWSGTHFIIGQITTFANFANETLWPTNRLQIYLAELMLRVRFVDGYLSFHKPWLIAKSLDEKDREKLIEVLYTAAESIRIITALLHPILPYATAKVWAQLGLGDIEQAARDGQLKDLTWGGLQPGTKLGPLSPIFPRADKGLAQIMADLEQPAPSRLTNELTTTTPETTLDPTHPAAPPRTGSLAEPDPIAQVGGSASPTTELHKTPSHTEAHASGPFASAQSAQPLTHNPQPTTHDSSVNQPASSAAASQITIDDFAKVELRVARILVAERIPKADKLLRLEVDLGYERRQILSGIAEWYTPEELIGRKIVVITNLAPRKMRGLESHGMLLAASTGENGKPALATFADSDNIEVGARLK